MSAEPNVAKPRSLSLSVTSFGLAWLSVLRRSEPVESERWTTPCEWSHAIASIARWET